MKKRVLGYNETISELTKGNRIISAPMSDHDYMIIDNKTCTIRDDFFPRALAGGMTFDRRYRAGSYVFEITLTDTKGDTI